MCWVLTRHQVRRQVAVHQDETVFLLDSCLCGHKVSGKRFTGRYPRPRG